MKHKQPKVDITSVLWPPTNSASATEKFLQPALIATTKQEKCDPKEQIALEYTILVVPEH
jgi:hypothetical protein